MPASNGTSHVDPPFPSPTKTWHNTTYASLSPTLPALSAAGKTILVTGAGTGIGAETARSFAAAGASRIALLGRRSQPLLDTKASINAAYPAVQVLTLPTDITDKAAVNTAFDTFAGADNAGGPTKIDILVSNAATIGPQESLGAGVDVDGMARSVDVNLRGAAYVAQAFLRHAAEDAVVLETNSFAAHLNITTRFLAYNVAKIAVFRLWDALGYEYPKMRVYHVQPGVVATDMNKEAGGVQATGIEDHVSLPATFMVWLASPEGAFLDGKYLWANWDVDELKARKEEIEGSRQLNLDLVGWPFGEGSYKTSFSDWNTTK